MCAILRIVHVLGGTFSQICALHYNVVTHIFSQGWSFRHTLLRYVYVGLALLFWLYFSI